MRALILIPVLALAAACNVTKSDNGATTVSYDENTAENAVEDVSNTAGNIADDISNDVSEAGDKIENEVGDNDSADTNAEANATANSN